MIIKLLSDSKETMWQEDNDYIEHKTLLLINEKEYIARCYSSRKSGGIYLFDNVSNKELSDSGTELWKHKYTTDEQKLFKQIERFSYNDYSTIRGYGKEGEVFLIDGNKIFNIIKSNENNVLVYDEDFMVFKALVELIEADINVIKYLDEFINKEECLEGDLDLWKLEEIPEILYNIISKLRGSLTLESVETLTDDAALALSKHRGDLNIGGIKSITETAAEYLSKHLGKLDLSGLESISDISAKYLAKYIGVLDLKKLTTIYQSGISLLIEQNGAILCTGVLYEEFKKKYSSQVRFRKIPCPSVNLYLSYINLTPLEGICIDIIKDINNTLSVILDKKNSMPITDFLHALGFTQYQILDIFIIPYIKVRNHIDDLNSAKGKKFALRVLQTWTEDLVDEITGDIFSIERNEILFEINSILSSDAIERIVELPIDYIYLQDNTSLQSEIIYNSLSEGKALTIIKAQQELYHKTNLSEASDYEIVKVFADRFAEGATIELGTEARNSLNKLLNISESNDIRLCKNDYVEIIKYLINN